MINNVSWQGYWISIALITTGYYLFIYLFYFRSDFKIFLNRKSQSGNNVQFTSVSNFQNKVKGLPEDFQQPSFFNLSGDFQSPPKDSEEYVVYACMDEMTAFFEAVNKTTCEKEKIIISLKLLLQKYPAIKVSQYKDSLTNVIVTQCEKICSIHLNAEDVVGLWLDR
jgi:hypothetical protein